MSTVRFARCLSASDMKLTQARSTSSELSSLNISRSKRASPGLSSTNRTFLIVLMLTRFVSAAPRRLLGGNRDASTVVEHLNGPGLRNNAVGRNIREFRNADSKQFREMSRG